MPTIESNRPAPWPALRAARHTTVPRRPVILQGPQGAVAVGSVAEAHLPALAAWPQWIDVAPHAVALHFGGDVDRIDAHWATVNHALRAHGLIVAWRDEPYGVCGLDRSCSSGATWSLACLGRCRCKHLSTGCGSLPKFATRDR